MKYNLNELDFLIGSLRDVIKTFGNDSKSIEFYKRQVDGLIAIGQIEEKSANMVERVVGMEHTNAVKWDKAFEKLNQFITGIEATMNLSDPEKKSMLFAMVKNGSLSESVRDLINEVYGIKSMEIKDINKGSFGNLRSASRGIPKNPTINVRESIAAKLEQIQGETRRELTLEVRNLGAVCSGDPTYYRDTLKNIVKSLRNNEKTSVLNNLKAGGTYRIGRINTTNDPCNPRKWLEQTVSSDVTSTIDWSKI